MHVHCPGSPVVDDVSAPVIDPVSVGVSSPLLPLAVVTAPLSPRVTSPESSAVARVVWPTVDPESSGVDAESSEVEAIVPPAVSPLPVPGGPPTGGDSAKQALAHTSIHIMRPACELFIKGTQRSTRLCKETARRAALLKTVLVPPCGTAVRSCKTSARVTAGGQPQGRVGAAARSASVTCRVVTS